MVCLALMKFFRGGYHASLRAVFFFLSKVLDNVLSPLSWGLVLLALAVPWRRRSMRQWKRRRAFGIAGLALLALCSSYPFSNAVQYRLEHATTATYRADVTYDTVVLLGGVVDEDATEHSGQPSYNDNVERLTMTERLLREGHAKTVIISGGTTNPKKQEFGEAPTLARQLREWGIADERIILEPEARNTRENALFSQRIAQARGFTRVLIVTSAFHMQRAAECFAAVNMPVDTLAVDYRAHTTSTPLTEYIPRTSALNITASMTREMAGRWIYRAQGYGKAAP